MKSKAHNSKCEISKRKRKHEKLINGGRNNGEKHKRDNMKARPTRKK